MNKHNRIRNWKAPALSDVVGEKARHFDLLLKRYSGLEWTVYACQHHGIAHFLQHTQKAQGSHLMRQRARILIQRRSLACQWGR